MHKIKNIVGFTAGFVLTLLAAYVFAGWANWTVPDVGKVFTYRDYLFYMSAFLVFLMMGVTEIKHRKAPGKIFPMLSAFYMGTLPIFPLSLVALYQPDVQRYYAWANEVTFSQSWDMVFFFYGIYLFIIAHEIAFYIMSRGEDGDSSDVEGLALNH